MNASPVLDLDRLFSELADQIYCLVKVSSDFPKYLLGSDLDIFCYNLESFSRKLLHAGHAEIERGFEIRVTSISRLQIHVDFLFGDELHLRFDLYGDLPCYKKLLIRKGFFSSIIEHAVEMPRSWQGGSYDLYVPDKIDDLVFRYIEFAEYFDVRPDKLKHVDYILNSSDETGRIRLLDKLHHYTKLPPTVYPNEPVKGTRFFQKLKNSCRKRWSTIQRVFGG